MKNLNEEYDKDIQHRDSKTLRFEFRELVDSPVSHIFELKISSKEGKWVLSYVTGNSLCTEVSWAQTESCSKDMNDKECWDSVRVSRPYICGTCMSHYSAYDVS